VSISAALHAAFACPATRYVDLDGSLELAEDIVQSVLHSLTANISRLILPVLDLQKLNREC
jgi:hypothetical protein